ncbi:hypothetical protein [Variovorax gossypii]
MRVALPRGTIDQRGEARRCKFVGAGHIPAIGAVAAADLVRAPDLDDLARTPAVVEVAVLLKEIGAAGQAGDKHQADNLRQSARGRTDALAAQESALSLVREQALIPACSNVCHDDETMSVHRDSHATG